MQEKPIIAIVGRHNVGKSSLFNKIVGRRNAIVDNEPGVTRDRHFAEIHWRDITAILIDTGGFDFSSKEKIPIQIRDQAQFAIEESTVVLFVVDGQEGLTEIDRQVATLLRKSQKKIVAAVNKIDHPKHDWNALEFHELGFDLLFPISAEHSIGITDLMNHVFDGLEPASDQNEFEEEILRISVLGRPNIGKSSLVNRILGEDRMIVHDTPGTTRDSVDTPFTLNGRQYLLVDTAGIRRKSRISQKLEKFCVIMAMRSIDRSDIAILMLDATSPITDQDKKIGSLIYDAGKFCVIVVNKWDLVGKNGPTQKKFREEIQDKLRFLSFSPIQFISAKTGLHVKKLFPMIDQLAEEKFRKIPTSDLNQVLEKVMQKNPPPLVRGKRFKTYYATQVSSSPPTFILFVNQPKHLPAFYKRYLMNQFREKFQLTGAPIRIVLKGKEKKGKGK